ncbi:methyltransferase domain-containing protein [Candidatus Woesearchaeota archaeon]|nr:methyltransferase domain-containing protein [Candidatus Woesearchaeota archaeon]
MKETKSAAYHTKIAKEYDASYTDNIWKLYAALEDAKIIKYLPKKKGRILDAGGGTGKFAIQFAKKGHDVVLTDISSGMLGVAEKNIKKLRLGNKVKALWQDITNMKSLQSNSFDFVVSLGDPVSYCMKENKAIKELARVAKKGAYVMITVDSYFSMLGRLISQQRFSMISKMERTGNTVYPFNYPEHNFKPDELRKLFEKNGLKVIEIFSIGNLINRADRKKMNKILSNKKNFKKMVDLELKYSTEPSIVGFGGHIGIVGRKK